MNDAVAAEMLRGWIMLANVGLMGLLASTALITVIGSLGRARASIRVRRR